MKNTRKAAFQNKTIKGNHEFDDAVSAVENAEGLRQEEVLYWCPNVQKIS
jgi:hypothetical protein